MSNNKKIFNSFNFQTYIIILLEKSIYQYKLSTVKIYGSKLVASKH
jgi:hypothetical protein